MGKSNQPYNSEPRASSPSPKERERMNTLKMKPTAASPGTRTRVVTKALRFGETKEGDEGRQGQRDQPLRLQFRKAFWCPDLLRRRRQRLQGHLQGEGRRVQGKWRERQRS